MSKIIPVVIVGVIVVFVLIFAFHINNHDTLIDYEIISIEYVEPFNGEKYDINMKDVKYLEPYLKDIYTIDDYKISNECNSEYGSSIIINGKHTLYYECNAKYDDKKVFVPEKTYDKLEMIREKY